MEDGELPQQLAPSCGVSNCEDETCGALFSELQHSAAALARASRPELPEALVLRHLQLYISLQ